MREGAAFARSLGDDASAQIYTQTADDIAVDLNKFWDAQKGYIRATVCEVQGDHGKTSSLDTCIMLGVLHAGEEAGEWSVTDDRVLASHLAIVESMRAEYRINGKYRWQSGIAVGRYPEDLYDGVGMSLAHPWYLWCVVFLFSFLG